MELVGNEKRIQALFHELKLADARVVPEFNRVWSCAQVSGSGSSRRYGVSLALAAGLFVIVMSSITLWSQNWRGRQSSNTAALSPTTTDSTPAPPLATAMEITPKTLAPAHPDVAAPLSRVSSNRTDRKATVRRHPNPTARNAVTQEAVAIASWQSPTAMLLQSPVDNVLTALPQLDRSLNELKTFLPDTPQ